MTELPIINRAKSHDTAIAIRSESGDFTYDNLLKRSHYLALALLDGNWDLAETPVAVLIPAGCEYAAVQWAVWRAGGVFLPLSLTATEPELHYALTDSDATIVVTTAALSPKVAALCRQLNRRLVVVEQVSSQESGKLSLPSVSTDRRAMILYTSGTTSKPKGVVTTHANIETHITSLVTAWEWSASDRIPLFLPLHHIHGIIAVLCSALWSGAMVEPFARFDLPAILARVRADAYTLFMAVPTIYVKIIELLTNSSAEERAELCSAFGRMRLMVSGSAALPARVHEEWYRLTGQKLLERYGMTEIGLVLSTPYRGERRPGTVGIPLPGVLVRLKTESGELVTTEGQPGEIQVRGPGVFREYANQPNSALALMDDGWFRTGDVAVVEAGYYRIMGRLSVDIIKSGGYKLSALEIEAVLLEHPSIRECAVVGVADATWGEAVAAAVVLATDRALELEALREWCRDRVSAYKIPRRLLVVESLPRNALGKLTKPAVQQMFAPTE